MHDLDARDLERMLWVRFGGVWRVEPLHASGFCETWRAAGPHGRLFLKSLPIAQAGRLDAEADGLNALAATGTIRVPAVAGCWQDATCDRTVLAIEWLDLRPADRASSERLGEMLGALHRTPLNSERSSTRFGWHRDNWIGATPQTNAWSDGGGADGWTTFFASQRLLPMRARLAVRCAEPTLLQATDAVIDALPRFFDDGHVPQPSLIHGDLWSGNTGMLADGTPVIFDPAVSYSDAECELAMMELFGRPPPRLRAAYAAAVGLHSGYARRRGLYQLYHLLNHALLFDGGYARQALGLAQALAKAGSQTHRRARDLPEL